MNELDIIKLNIYEAYDNNEISYGEKEYLLEQVNYMYEDAYSRRIRRYHELSKSSNPYLSKAADEKREKLKAAQRKRGRYVGIGPKGQYTDIGRKVPRDIGLLQQRVHDNIERHSDDLANKKSDTFLDKQKQKDEAVAKLIKAGMSPEEAKKAISNSKKAKDEADKVQAEFKKKYASESAFETLLESINDLYYED